jgi:hypothetical protein
MLLMVVQEVTVVEEETVAGAAVISRVMRFRRADEGCSLFSNLQRSFRDDNT